MLKTNHRKSNADSKGGRLDRELAFLFGRDVLAYSKQMSLEETANEAELVAEAARQLREHQGKPEDQRRIVQAMAEDTAAALCKWIREPGCMSAVIARSVN